VLYSQPRDRRAHQHAPAPADRARDDPPARRGRCVKTLIGNHSFRGTGITAFLKNGGAIENATAMANHASTKTTQLYDRRRDDVSQGILLAL
jgi:hypothetical protein